MSTRPVQYFQAAVARLRTVGTFVRYTLKAFVGDGCLTGAGALSYTTLVALVPVTAIALAVLSAFPVFADKRDALLATLFRAFVPEVSGEVEWWFRYFAGTSVSTTTIGVSALAVTVVLLLATIEDQLHRIWRVKSHRPWVQRILAYWAILTLGPLLLGVSFSLPGYIDIFARNTGLAAYEPSGLWDEPVHARVPACGAVPVGDDRLHAGLRTHPQLLGALARGLLGRCRCRRAPRSAEERLRALCQLSLDLSCGLWRAGGDPDLPAVDVCARGPPCCSAPSSPRRCRNGASTNRRRR